MKKLLLIPQLIYYGVRAPRDQGQAWDRFWSGVQRTGTDGDVLWDTEDARELEAALAQLGPPVDRTLPIVDVGCGNGRYARALASHFPRAVGVDVSAHAVERAREESRPVGNVSFRVLDVGAAGACRELSRELGPANVYMRGVLHVLDPKRRAIAVENLRELVGDRGAVYLSETNIEGDPLDHLVLQGATPTSMPGPLRRCIAAGIRPPSHFGEPQVREYFPGERWELLGNGPITMYTVPLTGTAIETLPSYFALVRARPAVQGAGGE
jgi:SAM-dependent methyltransferase